MNEKNLKGKHLAAPVPPAPLNPVQLHFIKEEAGGLLNTYALQCPV